jgi:hypothetical protein
MYFLSLTPTRRENAGWYDAGGFPLHSSPAGSANRNKLARAILDRARVAGVVLPQRYPAHDMSPRCDQDGGPAALIDTVSTPAGRMWHCEGQGVWDTLARSRQGGMRLPGCGVAGVEPGGNEWAADAGAAKKAGDLDGPPGDSVTGRSGVVLDRWGYCKEDLIWNLEWHLWRPSR